MNIQEIIGEAELWKAVRLTLGTASLQAQQSAAALTTAKEQIDSLTKERDDLRKQLEALQTEDKPSA